MIELSRNYGGDSADPVDPADLERRFVIGTAGHVDHGKSTLVKALTGIDPDRLAEEKARSMTIDLGFAWLTLPSGRQVSVIDVPGHERFIKNMLAGVGGIDLAVLVVAADEGPMPQTVEHLAILDLLHVEHGIVVLTKADTVDADWLDLMREETRDRIAGTVLAEAPIVAVSAHTGAGLPELIVTLDQRLSQVPARTIRGRPRLPIDRVFTVAGFGTVVTGTLIGGELTIGQELRLEPKGLPTRIRGLQSHRAHTERAQPGSRVAVNVSGLAVDQIRRGDVIAPPGLLRPTHRLDVRLTLLAGADLDLTQNDTIDVFAGAAELPASLTLLDRERLQPGETGWVQLRFREPVAVLKGDRLIVRRPSPSETIGGGEVIDPNPPRHRRFRAEVVGALETLAAGSPDELVLQALADGPLELRALPGELGIDADQLEPAVDQLLGKGDLRILGESRLKPRPSDLLVTAHWWEVATRRLRDELGAFHRAQPLRPGIARERLRSGLRLPPRIFDALMRAAAEAGLAVDDGASVRLPEFRIELDPHRRAIADRFIAAIERSPFAPPLPSEVGVDPDTLAALHETGEVIRVGEAIAYTPAILDRIVREVLRMIDRDGSLTLAGFRDHFQTSRKYAQPTLEYLDQQRVTRRVGDERVRYAGPGATSRERAS